MYVTLILNIESEIRKPCYSQLQYARSKVLRNLSQLELHPEGIMYIK